MNQNKEHQSILADCSIMPLAETLQHNNILHLLLHDILTTVYKIVMTLLQTYQPWVAGIVSCVLKRPEIEWKIVKFRKFQIYGQYLLSYVRNLLFPTVSKNIFNKRNYQQVFSKIVKFQKFVVSWWESINNRESHDDRNRMSWHVCCLRHIAS